MKAKYIFYALIVLATILLGTAFFGTVSDWDTDIICWSLVSGVCVSVGLLTWKAIFGGESETEK